MNEPSLFIDNVSFAKKNHHIHGSVPLASLLRFQELIHHLAPSKALEGERLALHEGFVEYDVLGKVNATGQCIVELGLGVHLTTFCQRCLSAMPLKLSLHFNYLIDEMTEAQILDADDRDDYDIQPASQSMDLLALIEDEIMMAMPISPMHEELCGELATQSGEKSNPFAVLKGLIKS